MKIKQTEIKLLQTDITSLKVDAIVNPAQVSLIMDRGVANIIKQRGGVDIEIEALSKGPIAIGQTVTTSAGQLYPQFVIHTALHDKDKPVEESQVRLACAAALKCAHDLKVSSLALPPLGCEVGGFPLAGSAKVITQEILKYVKSNPQAIPTIIICLYNEEIYQPFLQTMGGYISHLRDTLGDGPYITVDVILEHEDGIVVIERSNPPYGWALPGGFVDYGESLEQAVRREAKEETNLELEDLRQFHTYSDPSRDPRFHTVTTVFIAQGRGTPRSGDDAKNLMIVPFDQLMDREYAFDHKEVLRDYLESRR